MAKSILQKKKDNPRSKYWKTKSDSLWGIIIHWKYPICAVGQDCSGRLESHHLISRANTATRHLIENGIGLCSKHHKFCNKLSAHGAPLAFAEWLQKTYPDQWSWCSENKHRIEKPDYKKAYENLLEFCKKNGIDP